jgi:hypothetical protein
VKLTLDVQPVGAKAPGDAKAMQPKGHSGMKH